jgi:hypothetical protein
MRITKDTELYSFWYDSKNISLELRDAVLNDMTIIINKACGISMEFLVKYIATYINSHYGMCFHYGIQLNINALKIQSDNYIAGDREMPKVIIQGGAIC